MQQAVCSTGMLLAKGSVAFLKGTLFLERAFSLRWLCQALSCLGQLLCKFPAPGFCSARNTGASSPCIWPCASPKAQASVVCLVHLLLLACRSEDQTCIALHTASRSPRRGTATAFTAKAGLIAQKNLLAGLICSLFFLPNGFQNPLEGLTCPFFFQSTGTGCPGEV